MIGTVKAFVVPRATRHDAEGCEDMSADESPRERKERVMAGHLDRLDRLRRILTLRSAMTSAHMRIMWLFTDGRTRTLKEIAEGLQIEQSTANRQVNGALEKGLLSRTRPDRRTAYQFKPTPEGRDLYERSLEYALDVYRTALEALGPDRQTFEEGMGAFIDAFADCLGATDAEGNVTPHSPVTVKW